MVYHERPGVYSNYDASSVWATAAGGGAVAVVAQMDGTDVTAVTSMSQAVRTFPEETGLLELLRLLYLNGAGTVLVSPAAGNGAADYAAAAAAVLQKKAARYLVCDSEAEEVQKQIKIQVEAAAQVGGECIGIVGLHADTTTALTARAAALNSERMVLVGPGAVFGMDGEGAGGTCGAAALAGVLAAQTDPAKPLSGAELLGLGAVSAAFDDGEIDTLVTGGVTAIEAVGGTVSVVRAVTTRTTTGGAADSTWRELSTMLIIDDVVPAVRQALKARFLRAKNNETTRGAIRSQVVVELEDRVQREIIESYDGVRAAVNASDPTVCDVEFSFTVVHGLTRIYLTAHITI